MSPVVKLDYKLSALQVASIFAAILFAVAIIRLFHHQTDDYAVPFFEYLTSLRLAIPPVAALVFTYALIFIGGVNISDAPKIVIQYLRNSFYQNQQTMWRFILISILMSVGIVGFTSTTPPPAYERLITILLGSEQDRETRIKLELQLLSDKNPELARHVSLVADVFAERSRRNFKNTELSTTTPRIFVRALDANVSSSYWAEHPLRKLALAEAYSMWAQAALSSPIKIQENEAWKSWIHKSFEINNDVASSGSPLATDLMKFSAMHNSANASLYSGDLLGAKEKYEEVLALNKNLSSGGNLVAVYALLGETKNGIRIGQEIRKWGMSTGKALTETSSYSSVVGNMAFNFMIEGNNEEASQYFAESYDLEADDLNALNLAMALFLRGDTHTANVVLQHFKYPPLTISEQHKRILTEFNACYYFVNAFSITNDNALLAAHLYTYLGNARTQNQLASISGSEIKALTKITLEALAQDKSACGYFNLVPTVRHKLSDSKNIGISPLTKDSTGLPKAAPLRSATSGSQ